MKSISKEPSLPAAVMHLHMPQSSSAIGICPRLQQLLLHWICTLRPTPHRSVRQHRVYARVARVAHDAEIPYGYRCACLDLK